MKSDLSTKLIEYSRGRIIGNEPQFLSIFYSAITAFAPKPKEYISTIVTGESSGGKTHVSRVAVDLLPPENVKHLTAGSEKAPIYSRSIRDDTIKFIQFAELQKLSPSIIEFMKSLSGDDDEFVYEYTNSVAGNTVQLKLSKKPYTITYAQGLIDKELQTRVMMVPIEENAEINKAVVLQKFGETHIPYKDHEYIYDVSDVASEITDVVRSLASHSIEVLIPYPRALIMMVNHHRAESKRHAQTISSLIKASARLNFWDREVDEDGRLIASAQDVVNLISMFPVLQSTMQGSDLIDSFIYNYLLGHPSSSDSEIIRAVEDEGLTELRRDELHNRLQRLETENYIYREASATGALSSANFEKRIVAPTVNWNEVYECDSSEVIDPLTGKVYKDIRSYGEYIIERYGLEIDEEEAERRAEKIRKDIGLDEAILRNNIITFERENEGVTAQDIVSEFNIPMLKAMDILQDLEASGAFKCEGDVYKFVPYDQRR
ncbi:MAG: hypothetical protein DRP09_19290 [Candidatus Thorarchaeota archaeon]|nr:MAG: hypothetical protein DRP09_19290 [Candidatus Thorarchaeota archaeon]